MSISKIHGRLHLLCFLLHFATIFAEKHALGPARATPGGSRAVPWASAGVLGRLQGLSGRPFWVKKWFLENMHAVEAPRGPARVWGALWRLRAPPAPFGTCHDAFGTCFVARAQCKKKQRFPKMHHIFKFSGEECRFSWKLTLFGAAISPEFIILLR